MKYRIFSFWFIFTFLCYAQKNLPKETIRFMAAGDLNIAHWITPIIDSKGSEYLYTYLNDFLSTSDLFFVNLEAPFCEKGAAYPKNFVFNVPTRHINTLKQGNINIVSLANNHILDYGIVGLDSTLKTLKKANIFFAGAGVNFNNAYSPALIEINNIKIALFAYSMTLPKDFWVTDSTGGVAYPKIKIMKNSIAQYRESIDHVLVSFHWGKELSLYPDEYQIRFAHLAIDYGADMVIGHHTHNLQGIEQYKNKYIFYSLGNFIFASYSDKVKDSIILEALMTKTGIQSIKVNPINVNNFEVQFLPRLLEGEKRTAVIHHLNTISQVLNDSLSILNNEGFIRSFQ